MIHLIRKFINTENTALNVLIEEGNETVKSKIGSAGDTGGSATAGTAMGKLNKLISDLTTHMGRWTNTRAGYVDDIRSYTVTNNTASKTGVLSAKLAYVISLLENTTYGLSAIETLIDKYRPWYATYGTTVTLKSTSSTISNISTNSSAYTPVFTFVAPADGVYRVDMAWKVVNGGETNYTSTRVYTRVADSSSLVLVEGSNYRYRCEDQSDLGAVSVGNTLSKTLTFSVYLSKGRSYEVSVYSSNLTGYTFAITSATVKYAKTLQSYS